MKRKVFPITCLSFAILLSACNREPEKQVAETKQEPVAVTACKTLSDHMTKIDAQSTLEELNQINLQLKDCIPQVDNKQILNWLEQSTTMYQKFLDTDGNTEPQVIAFTDYSASILENSPEDSIDYTKGDAKLFKTLSARDQYLIQNLGKSYLDLQYLGEGVFQYRRQPNYLIDVFAPHLSGDQTIFLKQMAKDNQKSFLNDGAITIPWSEIGRAHV